MIKKKWKVINNFKDIVNDTYEISYEGEVRKYSSKEILHKKIANRKNHPYYAVSLKNCYGKTEWVLVHQLVAYFFIKVPKKYKDCDVELVPDHLDNNGLNNHYTNLEWKTRGENVSSAHKHGFINNKGDSNKNAIITDEQAREICEYLCEGIGYSEILDKMNFPDNKSYRSLLVRIKNRNAWRSVSDDYTFDSKKVKYTSSQRDTIEKLPLIRLLIGEGKSNYEIIRIVWGDNCSESMKKSKNETIKNIRNNKIFKDIQ